MGYITRSMQVGLKKLIKRGVKHEVRRKNIMRTEVKLEERHICPSQKDEKQIGMPAQGKAKY